MKITDEYVFFYKDWLSNFQRTKFIWALTFPAKVAGGLEFTSTEQAFMYAKAMFFHDYEIADQILKTTKPNDARLLGRKVRNYNDKEWDKVRYDIFYSLNLAKYNQDSKLKQKLLDSQFNDKVFVEASPIDRIWGIGYDEDHAEYNEHAWGRNYLGKILTNIRNRFKQHKENDTKWNIYTYSGTDEEETDI